MNNYSVEITDTFSDEANYSWVKRLTVEAESIDDAITKISLEIYGGEWEMAYGDKFEARYNMIGNNVCLFIEEQE